MIILPSEGGLLLVRQTDHAEASGRIAAVFRRPAAIPEPMWARFIEAVRHHDDGWLVEEREPALDGNGRPYDFKDLPTTRHIEVWRRSVDLVRQRDPFATVLIARHGAWLSRRADEHDPHLVEPILRFQREMESTAEVSRRALREGSPEERAVAGDDVLEQTRKLFGLFDGLSLAALGAIPLPSRTDPLPVGDARAELAFRADGTGTILIDPWPFFPAEVAIEVPALRIHGRSFRSPRRMAAAMERSSAEGLRSVLKST